MPQFSKFSIWDDCLLSIADKCVQHPDFQTQAKGTIIKEDIIEFFYTVGGIVFHKSEISSVFGDCISYLKEHREMPPFPKNQIIGNKTVAFAAMRKALVEEFPVIEDIINSIYDREVQAAIDANGNFMDIEARARTARSKNFNASPSKDKDSDQFDGLLCMEFEKIKNQTADSRLKKQISDHIIYIGEAIRSASPSTRQRSFPAIEFEEKAAAVAHATFVVSQQHKKPVSNGMSLRRFFSKKQNGSQTNGQHTNGKDTVDLPLPPGSYAHVNK